MWRRWHDTREPHLREQIITHYLPHARMLAAVIFARRLHDEVEFNDYLQLASLGLVEAVDRFDPQQGVQFETFCAKRIRGAVLSGLPPMTEKGQQVAARLRLRKERLASIAEGADAGGIAPASNAPEALFGYLAEVGIGLALSVLLEGTGMLDSDAFGSAATVASPEVVYFQRTGIQQLAKTIGALVEQLPGPQQTVIRAHYLHDNPFGDIASMMSLTRARISQLHRQALLRLRELLPQDIRCDVSL